MDNYVQHCLEEEIEDLKARISSWRKDPNLNAVRLSEMERQLDEKRDQLDLLLNKNSDFNQWL